MGGALLRLLVLAIARRKDFSSEEAWKDISGMFSSHEVPELEVQKTFFFDWATTTSLLKKALTTFLALVVSTTERVCMLLGEGLRALSTWHRYYMHPAI